MPPALEAKSPNHWTTREVPLIHFKVYFGWCSFRSLNFKICYWTFKPFCLLRKRNQGWGWCSTIQSQLLSYVRIFWETVSCSVVFDSLQPHRLQPTRLLCPRDFSGKNTGVGCHFLLQSFYIYWIKNNLFFLYFLLVVLLSLHAGGSKDPNHPCLLVPVLVIETDTRSQKQ